MNWPVQCGPFPTTEMLETKTVDFCQREPQGRYIRVFWDDNTTTPINTGVPIGKLCLGKWRTGWSDLQNTRPEERAGRQGGRSSAPAVPSAYGTPRSDGNPIPRPPAPEQRPLRSSTPSAEPRFVGPQNTGGAKPSFSYGFRGSFFYIDATNSSSTAYQCYASYSYTYTDFGERKSGSQNINFLVAGGFRGTVHSLQVPLVDPQLTGSPTISCS